MHTLCIINKLINTLRRYSICCLIVQTILYVRRTHTLITKQYFMKLTVYTHECHE